MDDIPNEVTEKLEEISKTYNIEVDKLLDMFVDKFYSESFMELFPSISERAKAIVNAIELDIRNNIRGSVNNIEEVEAIPFGIQQLGRTKVRLLCMINDKPSLISFKEPQTSILNNAVNHGLIELIKRKYKLKVKLSRLENLYFPAFDIDFTEYSELKISIDPLRFYNDLKKHGVNISEINLKDMIKGSKFNSSAFSSVNERGYADVWDLRIFKGYLVERTRSGFRFDDYSLDPNDLSEYDIEEGKVLYISKTSVVVSCHNYFIKKLNDLLKKIPQDIISSIKPYVTVIGTLELRPLNFPSSEVEYYRPHINAVYIQFERVI